MEVTFRESYPPENTKLTVKPLLLKHGVLAINIERTYDNSDDVEILDFYMDSDDLFKFIGVLHKQLKEINKYDKSLKSNIISATGCGEFYSYDRDMNNRYCGNCGKHERVHSDRRK